MGLKQMDEFRKDAVRVALTSGLTHEQVADDLSVHCPAAYVYMRERGEEHRITFLLGGCVVS